MENSSYHIKIKKEYASALIEDLLQVDAIEIIEDQVPEWQKSETLLRLKAMKDEPDTTLSESEFFEKLSKK